MTSSLRSRRRRRHPKTALLLVCGLALVVSAGIWVWIALADSGPEIDASKVTWPSTGAAALAIGDESAASPSDEVARPIASLTKLVTALVVLDAAPLSPGEHGPAFAMTDADALFAEAERERGGGSVPVTPGDVLTERQLLEHMLVASSNNHATTLVTRIFGDEQYYLAAARRWLDEHELTRVQVADASGMSPDNRASARDLLEIGRAAADDPVIAEIAALRTILSARGEPIAATNDLLGTLGIDGLKTGYTDAAGHTMLFTARVGADQDLLIGALLGAPSQAQRDTDVTRLIASATSLLHE